MKLLRPTAPNAELTRFSCGGGAVREVVFMLRQETRIFSRATALQSETVLLLVTCRPSRSAPLPQGPIQLSTMPASPHNSILKQ